MKPTCQDFVFARDGGMGRSPTEEAIIDYIDRSEEVATPSPAVEREIVVGSTWSRKIDNAPLRVECVGPKGVDIIKLDNGFRAGWTEEYLRDVYKWVSDPQPASPDARFGPPDGALSVDVDHVRFPEPTLVPEPTDTGVIRAAEGKVLELGARYRGVTALHGEARPDDVFLCSERMEPGTITNRCREMAGWFAVRESCSASYFTAVRRVQEQAPQAEAATGELYVPKVGERVRVVEVAPFDRDGFHTVGSEGEYNARDSTAPSSSHPDWICLWTRHKRGGTYCRVEPVTEPIAPATPRSESASHAHWVQVADTRLGQIRGLNKQLDSTRNELHRASIGRSEALAKAAEQSSRITHLEASLETAAREEQAIAWDKGYWVGMHVLANKPDPPNPYRASAPPPAESPEPAPGVEAREVKR